MRPVGSLPSFLILNFQPSTFYVFFNQYPLELMLQFYDVTAYIFSITLINLKKYHVESRVRIIPTKFMGILCVAFLIRQKYHDELFKTSAEFVYHVAKRNSLHIYQYH